VLEDALVAVAAVAPVSVEPVDPAVVDTGEALGAPVSVLAARARLEYAEVVSGMVVAQDGLWVGDNVVIDPLGPKETEAASRVPPTQQ